MTLSSLFLSVHLDDAVFSCGRLISGMEDVTALTVFGGMPKNKLVTTAYDQKSNFENAEQAILGRRNEDATALTLLGAEQRYLEFTDSQYGEEHNIKTIRDQVTDITKEYDEIYVPLGFNHRDHEAVGSLLEYIVKSNKGKPVYVYMDLPYYVDDPESAVDRLRKIELGLDYEFRGGDLGKKMLAIACYKSQVPITNLYHLMCNERYYRVTS